MAALVESIFYTSNDQNNRFVPWHGIGTPVKESPTSEDAIRLANLDWVVESKPVFDESGKEIPGFKANTRSSDNSILGIVSNKYKIIQNSEAFEFTDNLISDEIRYETAGSLRNGKTIWLLAKLPEKYIIGDKFDPYICFTNNHDGKGAVTVCMTPIRVVCNNTLNLALGSAKRSWSIRHLGDITSKLHEARHTLALADLYMDNLDLEANRLASIKITDPELEAIFDDLYPIKTDDSSRKKTNIISMKEDIFKKYESPDISKFKGTAWGVINAVTDFAAHTAPARLTQSFQENNWGRIIGGHPVVDAFYKKVA